LIMMKGSSGTISEVNVLQQLARRLYPRPILSNVENKCMLLIKRGPPNFKITHPKGEVYDYPHANERRYIINHDDLKQKLEIWCCNNRYALKVIELEQMDIYEQIEVFRDANVIVAQHGASLVNTVWCYNCDLVIEYVGTHGVHHTTWFDFLKKYVTKNWVRFENKTLEKNTEFVNVDVQSTIAKLSQFTTL
jgi:hypothetical protein